MTLLAKRTVSVVTVTLSGLLVAAMLLPSVASATTYVDDFEGGLNPSGWAFIRGGDVFEGSGGNPGGWLHQPSYDTFAPRLDHVFGVTTPFDGDYQAANVTRISLDAQTLDLDFGTGDGFQLTLVLRDEKGTPFDVSDDDYVYFVGPNVPLVGAGWTHYDFDIPSQFAGTLPPGWKGGWFEDCENLRPGVVWADVVKNVQRVEFWWIDPCLFAIFQNWNVGADNIAIEFGDPAGIGDDVGAGPGSDPGTGPGTGPETGPGAGPGDPNDVDALPGVGGTLALAIRPNPLVGEDGVVSIELQVDQASHVDLEGVRIEVVGVDGRRIETLAPGEPARAGATQKYSCSWDGRDAGGRPVPAGVYFIRATAGGRQISRAITVTGR